MQLGLQVHIDQEEEVSRTPGPVKLLLPRLADMKEQLQKLQPRFVNTCFAFDFPSSPQAATVVDPWGQQFSVTDSSGKNLNSSSVEGLVLPCHPGTADAIAEFYRRIVGVSCMLQSRAWFQVISKFAVLLNRQTSLYTLQYKYTVKCKYRCTLHHICCY